MEKSDSRITAVKWRAALDVQVVVIGVTMSLDMAVDEQLYLTVPGGYFL